MSSDHLVGLSRLTSVSSNTFWVRKYVDFCFSADTCVFVTVVAEGHVDEMGILMLNNAAFGPCR